MLGSLGHFHTALTSRTSGSLKQQSKRVLFTVQRPKSLDNWTLINFNDCLGQNSEPKDLMKQISSKTTIGNKTNIAIYAKVASKSFAANTQSKGTQGEKN